MKASDRDELLRVLDNLRRSERFIRASISELERTLAAMPDGQQPAGLADAGAAYQAEGAAAATGHFHNWTMATSVLHLLGRARGDLTNADILAGLVAGGFGFRTSNRAVAVAQCLKRLEMQGKVERLARGNWMLSRKAAPP